jgi:hypothetical protein
VVIPCHERLWSYIDTCTGYLTADCRIYSTTVNVRQTIWALLKTLFNHKLVNIATRTHVITIRLVVRSHQIKVHVVVMNHMGVAWIGILPRRGVWGAQSRQKLSTFFVKILTFCLDSTYVVITLIWQISHK